jgi:hypothetical protein
MCRATHRVSLDCAPVHATMVSKAAARTGDALRYLYLEEILGGPVELLERLRARIGKRLHRGRARWCGGLGEEELARRREVVLRG